MAQYDDWLQGLFGDVMNRGSTPTSPQSTFQPYPINNPGPTNFSIYTNPDTGYTGIESPGMEHYTGTNSDTYPGYVPTSYNPTGPNAREPRFPTQPTSYNTTGMTSSLDNPYTIPNSRTPEQWAQVYPGWPYPTAENPHPSQVNPGWSYPTAGFQNPPALGQRNNDSASWPGWTNPKFPVTHDAWTGNRGILPTPPPGATNTSWMPQNQGSVSSQYDPAAPGLTGVPVVTRGGITQTDPAYLANRNIYGTHGNYNTGSTNYSNPYATGLTNPSFDRATGQFMSGATPGIPDRPWTGSIPDPRAFSGFNPVTDYNAYNTAVQNNPNALDASLTLPGGSQQWAQQWSPQQLNNDPNSRQSYSQLMSPEYQAPQSIKWAQQHQQELNSGQSYSQLPQSNNYFGSTSNQGNLAQLLRQLFGR